MQKIFADDRAKKLMRTVLGWFNCNGCSKGFKMMTGPLTVWVLLFFLAFMRYELRVFTIEQRMNVLETMIERGDSDRASALMPLVESRKIPVKPLFYNPVSIVQALSSEHDVEYKSLLMKNTADPYLLKKTNKSLTR